jgi:hypothetical protein
MIDQATRDTICERIANDESLRSICRDLGLSSHQRFLEAVDSDEELRTKYARAMLTRADAIHESMAEIEQQVKDETLKPDAARVVLWSRQWRASKLMPKKYGDKLELDGKVGVAVTLTPGETQAL